MAMLNKTAVAAVATAVMVMAGPASAFTPAGSVMEAADSTVSSTWQPMAAQRNDSIAKACEGFKYRGCVREFVSGNRDKFPEQFKSESDFWLYEKTEYMVPLLSGAKASAIQTQTSPSGPRPSMVEIMNGLTANQEEMAAELARLSKDFGLLAVEDIDGLGDLVIQMRQQTEGFAEVQSVVQRLEDAFVLAQSEALTSGRLRDIQAENVAALKPVFADIEALQQADITFSQRLDVVEADVANITEQLPTTVKTEVESQLGEQLPAMTEAAETAAKETATAVVGEAVGEATYWNYWLTLAALIIALLTAAGTGWLFFNRTRQQKVVASHEKQLNDENGLANARQALDRKHNTLAEEVHDEENGLAATRDLATQTLSQTSPLKSIKTPDLSHVNHGATSHWTMTDGHQNYEVSFTKRDDGQFDCSVPRNKDGTGTNEPVAFNSIDEMMKMLRKAHAKGRLQHCCVVAAKAA
jgi:hypothetical protein